MARPVGRPKGKAVASPPVESTPIRPTIINLKGNDAQSAWLEAVNKKTHIAKSVIVRLALSDWAAKNGLPPFPPLEDQD